MGYTEQDRQYMRRALELAAEGQGFVEPNPMVGAVLVKQGRIIGEGYHRALEAAASRGCDAAAATLYVTLEPCNHHGKTPPCAPAVAEAGVSRVVAATLDPMWGRARLRSRRPG